MNMEAKQRSMTMRKVLLYCSVVLTTVRSADCLVIFAFKTLLLRFFFSLLLFICVIFIAPLLLLVAQKCLSLSRKTGLHARALIK